MKLRCAYVHTYYYHLSNLYFPTLQHIVRTDLKLERFKRMNKGQLLKPLNMPTTIVGTFYHGQGFLEKLQPMYFIFRFHLSYLKI